MKKAVITVLCSALLAVLGGCQRTGIFTSGEYQYSVSGTSAAMKAYSGTQTVLTLPAKLDGHTLSSVDSGYFPAASYVSVVALEIPEGYTAIDSFAFSKCSLLTTVKLPNTLRFIGYGAFEGCQSLRRLELPQGLKTIRSNAFLNSGLESINIPDTVTEFGENPFAGCKQLREITLSDDHPQLRWMDGVLVSREGNALLVYPASRTDTEYMIPSSVERIGHNAFSGCTSLQNIELPSGVVEIGNDAFSGCTALEAAVIPASVTTFGDRVFEGCESLTLVAPSGSAAERYAKEYKLPYRYSVAETRAEEAPGDTPVPSNALSTANQPQTPPATAQPSATLEPPSITAKDFRWPVPAAGERLYIGEAEVPQAERMYLAFIVSADGGTIHDLTIHSENVDIQYKDNGVAVRLTAGSITEVANGALSVGQGATDVRLGETQINQLVIAGDTASCTLAYVYQYTDPDTGSPVTLPFGIATVTLQNYAIAATPAANPALQPPSAAEVKARGFDLPVPVGGERLYIGAADVSQAQNLYVAFILSANGTEMHDLTIYIADLAIKIESGSTVTKLTGGSRTEEYQGTFTISDRASAINLGRTQITDFIMTGDTASCILAYVYHYSGSLGSGASPADVPFDVATVAFKRQ